MNERLVQNIKTPDDVINEKMADYITGEKITADELRQAYYLFCGVTDEHSSPRVHATANLMSEMSAEHYPLNRFVSMIGILEEWEDSPIKLASYIDSLPISDKEKDMIKSIPEKARLGELSLVVNGKVVKRILINTASNSAGFHLALHEKLKEAMAITGLNNKNDISIWFEEK